MHWHDHDYASAYACLLAATTHGAPRHRVLYVRGQVLAEWGNFEAAVADLSAALRLSIDADHAAYARTTRAFAYANLGRTKMAMREFAAAENVTPDNGWLHYFRALSHRLMGDEETCFRGLERALRANVPPLNAKKREHALALLREAGKSAKEEH